MRLKQLNYLLNTHLNKNKMKPHKHEKEIKAWADGYAIECTSPQSTEWEDAIIPTWSTSCKYRVKTKFKVGDKVNRHISKYFTETLTVTKLEWVNENSEIVYTLSNGHTCFEQDLSLVINIKPKFNVGDVVTFTDIAYYVEKTIKSIKMDTQRIVYFFTDGTYTESENKLHLVPTIPFTFADAEFLLGKTVKSTHHIGIITSCDEQGVIVGKTPHSYKFFHAVYAFLDGTPCGKAPVWEPEIPEIGEWAFFWDSQNDHACHWAYWAILGSINGYTTCKYETTKGFQYNYCSKTPPPHLGGK